MSGPIVRSGPTPEYSKNWSQAFGSKKKSTTTAKKKSAPKKSAKPAKKKS